MNILLKFFLIALFFSLTGCEKDDEVYTGSTGVWLNFVKNFNISNDRTSSGSFSFSKATVAVKEYRLSRVYGKSVSSSYLIEGPFKFDLLNAKRMDRLGSGRELIGPGTEVEPGFYTDLEVVFSNVLENGAAVFVSGTFNDNGTNYPFDFSIVNFQDLGITEEAGVKLEEGVTTELLVGVDLEVFFTGVDFSTIPKDERGLAHISANSNAVAFGKVLNNVNNNFAIETGVKQSENGLVPRY